MTPNENELAADFLKRKSRRNQCRFTYWYSGLHLFTAGAATSQPWSWDGKLAVLFLFLSIGLFAMWVYGRKCIEAHINQDVTEPESECPS